MLIAVALFQYGCLSVYDDAPAPKISLLSNFKGVLVDGQPIKISQLGAKLKAMHVPKKTAILVTVPKNVPSSIRDSVGRSLMSSGYMKFMLVTPKQVSATLSTSTPDVKSSSTTTTSSKKKTSAGTSKTSR